MSQRLLREVIRNILCESTVENLTSQPVPNLNEFKQLERIIVGDAKTLGADINEIAATAHVNKGSDVNIDDVASYARGGSASSVIIERFRQVMAKAEDAGLAPQDASTYIAGEIARGNAMGAAALADSGGGEGFWTADRGANLSEFTTPPGSDVTPVTNPTDFIIVRPSAAPIGYSAKSTAGAAGNFLNSGVKAIEDLAGYTDGVHRGIRAQAVRDVYAKGDQVMEDNLPGYLQMSKNERKQHRDLAKKLGLYDAVQSGIRDVLHDGIIANASQDDLAAFVRETVAGLPNPAYKVVYSKGLSQGVLKPPTGTGATAIHFSNPDAEIKLTKSGGNGITFNSSVAGKLFTYRIKFVSGYGTNLKSAVVGK